LVTIGGAMVMIEGEWPTLDRREPPRVNAKALGEQGAAECDPYNSGCL
jgi:hypothetical protein